MTYELSMNQNIEEKVKKKRIIILKFMANEDEESNMDTPKTEIEQRFAEIVDILDNLYKLSVRIRKPTLRNRYVNSEPYEIVY